MGVQTTSRDAGLSDATDEQLMCLIASGNVAALGPLVERYHRPLFAYVYRLSGGDEQLAADLVQETFMHVLMQRTYRGDLPLKPWIYRVASNVVQDHFRSSSRRERHIFFEAQARLSQGPEQMALARERERLVAAALAQLAEEYRTAIVLRYYQGLRLHEIAEVLDIPLGNGEVSPVGGDAPAEGAARKRGRAVTDPERSTDLSRNEIVEMLCEQDLSVEEAMDTAPTVLRLQEWVVPFPSTPSTDALTAHLQVQMEAVRSQEPNPARDRRHVPSPGATGAPIRPPISVEGTAPKGLSPHLPLPRTSPSRARFAWLPAGRSGARQTALAALAALAVFATLALAWPAARTRIGDWLGLGGAVRHPLVLGSVDFRTPQQGWITIGNTRLHHGAVFGTNDGGRSWQKLLTFGTGTLGQSFGLLGTWMDFPNARDGFLYTAEGTDPISRRQVLYRTTNGGETWTHRQLPQETKGALLRFDFVNESDGWILAIQGGLMGSQLAEVLRTTDAGAHWQAVASTAPTSHLGKLGPLGFDSDITFQSPRSGWIVGEGAPSWGPDYMTVDGGRTWRQGTVAPSTFPYAHGLFENVTQQLASPSFFGHSGLLPVASAAFRSGTPTPVAVAYFMYRVAAHSLDWARPLRLPLRSRAFPSPFGEPGAGTPLPQILNNSSWFFIDGNRLVATLDGGRHWSSRPLELRSGFTPSGLHFFNASAGIFWAATSRRANGFASQSFLARTSDGGRSWHDLMLPGGL